MEYEYGVRVEGSDLIYGKGSRELAEAEFTWWTKKPGEEIDYKPVLVRRPIATEWETF